MASSSQNTTFPMNGLAPMIAIKLSGSNYIYWHKQMLPILSYQHLLPHVDGSQIAPPPTITKNDKEVDNPEYFSWIQAEQQAIISINASLTEEALAVTVGLTTARDIWVSLETAFCNTSVERVQNLRDNLRVLKKGDKTVAEFGREFKAICDQLHAVGHPVDTMDQLHWFLCGLGKSFESFSTNMRSTRPIPTFVDLLASAESHELFIKNLHSEPAPPSVAFVAQSARPTNQQQHRGNNMSQSHMYRPKNNAQHFRPNRPNRPNFRGNQRMNFGQQQNQFGQQQYHFGQPQYQNYRPPICQLCRKPGHFASQCYHLASYAALALPTDDQLAQAFHAQCNLNATVPDWTSDTGASTHMLPTSTSLENSTPDRRTKQTIAKGCREDGLYVLRDNHEALVSSHSCPKASFEIWHSRLGHVNFDVVSLLKNNGSLSFTSVLPKPGLCSPCELNNKRASSPLELIHCDLWGPSSVKTVDNFSYYVAFVDDYSRFTWLYPLRAKSDFVEALSISIPFVQTQFSSKIKTFQSDGGTEFANNRVRKLFEQNGTFQRMSCPYTPQQNGRVERKHRHIVETGLAMLFHAKLPATYWVDAFSSAVFIINRLPTTLLYGKSPFEILYHQRPNFASFRSFGCRVYPYLRDYTPHKLSPRSIPCIFVGYSSKYKGYLCLDPCTSRIYVTRNARFDEHHYPLDKSTNASPITQLEVTTFIDIQSDDNNATNNHFPNSSTTKPTDPIPNMSLPTPPITVPFFPIPYTTQNNSPHNSDIITSHSDSQYTTSPITALNPSGPSPLNPTTSDHIGPSDPHTPTSTPPTTPSTTPPSSPNSSTGSTCEVSPAHDIPAPVPPPISSHPMITRAKSGIFKPRHLVDLAHTENIPLHKALFATTDPNTFNAASKDEKWVRAMDNEFYALHKNNTWTLVPRPPNVNVAGSKWLFRTKFKADGSVERYKARLVAQGFTQVPGLDYSHTFSPVVKAATVRTVLSLAVINGWMLHQLDVNNAFLHGNLTENVYMEQPKGFVDTQFPSYVCKLNKAIYGLKQAPRAWFHRLSLFLTNNGFSCSRADPSLFIFKRDSCVMYLLVYVDDLILTGNQNSIMTSFISRLNKEFAIKDLGKLNYFLGLEVTYTQHGTSFRDATHYRSIVGALQYLTITRPDIAYAVNQVSQFLHAPTVAHFQEVKRILRYLKGTIALGLHYSRPTHTTLLGYSDADWARCLETRRSTYGYSIFLGGNLISWSAKKQPTVARFSCESEYRAMANTAAEIVWLTHLLQELHALPPDRPTILCDNQSAIFLTQNPVSHKRAKHIDLDYHFLRELVAAGKLATKFVPTKLQVADIFTKSLPSSQFNTFRQMLRIGPPPFSLRGDVR
uniref:Putative zinc finger, CCHC-type n=1 Tax=Helianthus annuus TaxID=4232 RepID=A0A251RWD9_HELAN